MSPALLPIVSKKTDLILTLVMTNSESWIVLLLVFSHTVLSTTKMHQMHIDATFGHLCIAWKIGIWKKWIKEDYQLKKFWVR